MGKPLHQPGEMTNGDVFSLLGIVVGGLAIVLLLATALNAIIGMQATVVVCLLFNAAWGTLVGGWLKNRPIYGLLFGLLLGPAGWIIVGASDDHRCRSRI